MSDAIILIKVPKLQNEQKKQSPAITAAQQLLLLAYVRWNLSVKVIFCTTLPEVLHYA